MAYLITKVFADFEAAHQLKGLPKDHQCARLHGHTYTVSLTLIADELDEVGFVIDFGKLAPFATHLKDKLDHRYLNDVVDFNTTCENLAKWLYDLAKLYYPQVVACTVKETKSGQATYFNDLSYVQNLIQ